MDYTHPQYHPQLKQLAVNIDTMDYYQILNLAQDALPKTIKQAYFAQSRSLHPDKFYHLPDVELKQAIHKIYKRITEAYVVLKDPEKRPKYTTGINSPDRQQRLRFSEQAEKEAEKEREEAREVCKTPNGKKLYRQVVKEMQSENWDTAFRHLQTITLYEPKNQAVLDLKQQIDRKRKGLPPQ